MTELQARARRLARFALPVLICGSAATLAAGEPICLTPAGGFIPCLTPDGQHVVYARSDGDETNIYVVAIAGGKPRRITKHGGDSPSVSPDGEWIAFVSRRTGLSKLYIIRLAGADERALSLERTWDTSPVWWPDGQSVVYATLSKKKRGIFRLGVTTGKSVQLHPRGSMPAISPDGKYLAFVETDRSANGQEIWLKELPDGTPRKLLGDAGTPQGGFFDPAWAPSGKHLFFATMRMQPSSDVGFVDVASRKKTMLTSDQLGNRWPRPSPNGSVLVFGSRRGTGKRLRVWRSRVPR